MFNQLSIRKLTIYISAAVTLINALIVLVYILFFSQFDSFVLVLGFIFTLIFFNFLILRFSLEEFVFRKVKLIYKIISEAKLSKKERESIDLGSYTMENVNDDVLQWAQNTKKEIENLKDLENYRKNFVGNISHELKTPIFSIQGYIHTLLDGGLYDPNINMNYLKRAASNVERLQNIVEDLDAISKLESGRQPLELRKFDIKALVKEVFDDLEAMAKEKEIKLSFKEGASTPFNVIADREAIRQVMNNLLVNSIKYGKPKGQTRVSFYEMEGQILIEVSDTGIGIEDRHLKHLFDRFYRVDTSRSRNIGGSGLGLSIVKHIIEAHNQTINVRSTPGIGSTFGFTLEKA